MSFASGSLWVFLAASALMGQTTGTIVGVVRDSSGAVTPNAKVTATNEATGYQRPVTADATGAYLIPLLPVGAYSVSAELSGFKKVLQQGVTLTVDQNVRVDLVLQLGEVTETINVEAAVRPPSAILWIRSE